MPVPRMVKIFGLTPKPLLAGAFFGTEQEISVG